jgi:GNAT superfamily N-acetyltransferase
MPWRNVDRLPEMQHALANRAFRRIYFRHFISIRQSMGAYPIPVVLLARLAAAITAQGQGLGVALLQDAIRRTVQVSEQVGIRALLTHPIDDEAARFYLRFGFVASPVRDGQLLLLLKDARRWV